MPTKKIVVALLIILVAVGGFVAGLILLRDSQDIRQEAAVPDGTATVSIEPATANFDVGDSFTSSIFFNSANVPISGIAVRLKYPYSGTTPEIAVNTIDINSVLLSGGQWTCPVKSSSLVGTEVVIDIACANQSQSGFISNQQVKLADINFSVNTQPAVSPLTMRFDPAESIITRKSDGSDILLIPSSTGSYSVGATTQPTTPPTSPTPTGAQTLSPTPTSIMTITPSPTSAQTATPTASTTKGGETLPDAGMGYPAIIGTGFGILVMLGAFLLAF